MEDSTHSQNSGSNDDLYLTGLVLAVVLGLLLVEAPKSIIDEPSFTNYRALLIFISLGVFIETYIMLSTYHREFRVPYYRLYLFFDIFLAFLFVSFVTLMRASQELERPTITDTDGEITYIAGKYVNSPEELVVSAIFIFILLFILLILRLASAFKQIRLDSKLKKSFEMSRLFVVPVVANSFGVLICIALLIFENKVILSWLGAIVFGIYMFFRYMVRPQFSLPLGRSDRDAS